MTSNRRLVQTYVILAAVAVILLHLILLFDLSDFFKGLL